MFLPSEVARLVLSYLLSQAKELPKTLSAFLEESPHLQEISDAKSQNKSVNLSRCAENPKWNYISRNVRKIRNGTAFPFRYIRVCRDSLDSYVQLLPCAQRVSMCLQIEL